MNTESKNQERENTIPNPTFLSGQGDINQKFIACEAPAAIKSNLNHLFTNVKGKQNQQLDFVINRKSPKRKQISPGFSTKRRLFSTNCNHYLN